MNVRTEATSETMQPLIQTEHPHIVKQANIGSGEPIIKNTRISVRLIAEYYKAGLPVEDILRDYPQLKTAAIYDAISYYLDHQAEIEALIAANRVEYVLAQSHLKLNEGGLTYQADSDDTTA